MSPKLTKPIPDGPVEVTGAVATHFLTLPQLSRTMSFCPWVVTVPAFSTRSTVAPDTTKNPTGDLVQGARRDAAVRDDRAGLDEVGGEGAAGELALAVSEAGDEHAGAAAPGSDQCRSTRRGASL